MELVKKTLEFKASDIDLEEGTFQGHASTFGNVDSQGDIIDKGAFKKTILEAGHRVKILFEHFHLVGKPIEMREDKNGLFVKGKISLTTLGKDVLTLMRDGALNEMSIGFQIIKSIADKENPSIRRIKEVKLWEFSLVPWGANELAKVTGVKNMPLMSVDFKRHLVEALKSDELKEVMKNWALTNEPPLDEREDPKESFQSLREKMDELNNLLK